MLVILTVLNRIQPIGQDSTAAVVESELLKNMLIGAIPNQTLICRRELHQCPPGQLFDALNGTCIPFIRMECNETTCTILSPLDVNNETEFIPVPVFFPQEPTTTVLTTLPPTTTTPSN